MKGRLLGLGLAATGGNGVQSLHSQVPVRDMPGKCRCHSTNAAELLILQPPSKALMVPVHVHDADHVCQHGWCFCRMPVQIDAGEC